MGIRRERPPVVSGDTSVGFRVGDRTFVLPVRDAGGAATCCFCAEAIADEDEVELTASWAALGGGRQSWAAHRHCLAERLHEHVRSDGPFFAGS